MRNFTWADGERTIHFGRGVAAEAVDALGGAGYTLLTTERALQRIDAHPMVVIGLDLRYAIDAHDGRGAGDGVMRVGRGEDRRRAFAAACTPARACRAFTSIESLSALLHDHLLKQPRSNGLRLLSFNHA